MSDFLLPPSEIKKIHDPPVKWLIFNFTLIANEMLSWALRSNISISKANCRRREWLTIHGIFSEITQRFPHVYRYIHAWWTDHEAEYPMFCLENVIKIQSYPVGQSSFTEKDLIYEMKKLLSKSMDLVSFQFHYHRHFDNDSENSRRLPKALHGTLCTKRFATTIWTVCTERNVSRMQRNALGTERNFLRTKRFGMGTKCFENGTLLRCSSALQGL